MSKTNTVKANQLGMSLGKANYTLHRNTLFNLACKLGLTTCFRCGKPIATIEDFSIDHKDGWMYSSSPTTAFFNQNNIAFSHKSCNSSARRCSQSVNSETGFKGVYLKKTRNSPKKFAAVVWTNEKQNTVGYFETAEQAAEAYDKAAVAAFGKRAVTNSMLGLLGCAKDLIKEALLRGDPVIDNTKDAAHYRNERAKRDKKNLAKHVFVEGVELGQCSLDPDTNSVRKKISFDFVYFQQEALLGEWEEEQEELLKQRVAEQVLTAIRGF